MTAPLCRTVCAAIITMSGLACQTQDRHTPSPAPVAADQAEQTIDSRAFLFTYSAKVTGLEPGQEARIWLPVATTNDDQVVTVVKQSPEGKITKESKYGNSIYYLQAKAGVDGSLPVSITYRVNRREVRGDANAGTISRAEAELFLKPDAKVPVAGKPLMLLVDKSLPSNQFQLGRSLYETVNEHMVYSKDQPGWGTGDAEWACDSRFGNCTDFHSLFISLSRVKGMPAKFEMGFSIPEEVGAGEVKGYHCWAKFNPEGKGWVPVDISEADKHPEMSEYYFGNLTADRVAFTVGRDITLEPRQDGPPLNFFIYPYVEVDGKAYPTEKVERAFSYEDLSGQAAESR